MVETPEMQSQLVSAHGMLAIMEVLESRISREVALKLLQIVNAVSPPFLFPPPNLIVTLACYVGHGFPREFLLDWVCI